MNEPGTKQNKTPKRVTTRDIANKLGLHFTTVAEALRGSPRVKAATRGRVEQAARKMGYFPDPVLGALNAYRNNQRHATYQGTLSWINSYSDKNYFSQKKYGYHHDCYVGACERAKEFGYKLDPFWLAEKDMSCTRAIEILENRNTAGIIVAPQPEDIEDLKFPWEKFSAVSIGYSAQGVNLPTVGPNQFSNTQRAYQRAIKAGFKRIGLAGLQWVDDRVGRGHSGGFLTARHRFGGKRKALPLFLDESINGDPVAFMQWLTKNQPDAILTSPGSLYYDVLIEAEIKIPDDLSVIALSSPSFPTHLTGIYESGDTVGRTAVDILVGMIRQFSRGDINHERDTLISGRWVDGETARLS